MPHTGVQFTSQPYEHSTTSTTSSSLAFAKFCVHLSRRGLRADLDGHHGLHLLADSISILNLCVIYFCQMRILTRGCMLANTCGCGRCLMDWRWRLACWSVCQRSVM